MNRMNALLHLKRQTQGRRTLLRSNFAASLPDAVAALLAAHGFDWIWVDTENGAISVETAQLMIQASQGTEAVPLV